MSATLRLVVLGAFAATSAAHAWAQGYPRGAINLVVPVAAGDAADVAGRSMADELSRLLNVPVVVQNRPGAGAVLGAGEVARARKDGQTLLLAVNSALTFRPVLDPKTVPYDPLRDLTPLGLATRTPAVLAVRSDSPHADFAALVAHARRNPGAVKVGTAGIGSSGHIFVEMVNAATGAAITTVPYTGASPAVAGLAGGFVDGVVVSLGAIAGQLRSGAMRAVVISSRAPGLAMAPTMSELGQGPDPPGVWMAFFAPAGVPAEVTAVLIPAIERVVRSPVIATRLQPLGMIQEYQPPDAVAAEVRRERGAVEAVARKAGLAP